MIFNRFDRVAGMIEYLNEWLVRATCAYRRVVMNGKRI